MSIQKRIWQSRMRNLPDFSPAESESPAPQPVVEEEAATAEEPTEEKSD